MSTPENSGALDSALAATEAADKPRLTSVGKALRLLAAFRGVTPPIGVSELARRSGLPKSTAFRFLADLEEVGFVERDGANYRLGLALFELGSRVTICRPNGLRDVAMPHLSELHVKTGHNVHLGVLDETEVMHVAKVNHGVQTLRTHLQPGSRVPATCSALGKAILPFSGKDTIRAVVEAGLPRRTQYSITEVQRLLRELAAIRDNGVAMDKEESTLGIIGIAAPVMLDGRAVAAVGLTMPAPATNVPRLASAVRTAAAAVSRDHARWAEELW